MLRIATCGNDHCSNSGIPIDVYTGLSSLIVCGVCSQPIKDVVNEYEDDDVEVPPWLV